MFADVIKNAFILQVFHEVKSPYLFDRCLKQQRHRDKLQRDFLVHCCVKKRWIRHWSGQLNSFKFYLYGIKSHLMSSEGTAKTQLLEARLKTPHHFTFNWPFFDTCMDFKPFTATDNPIAGLNYIQVKTRDVSMRSQVSEQGSNQCVSIDQCQGQ